MPKINCEAKATSAHIREPDRLIRIVSPRIDSVNRAHLNAFLYGTALAVSSWFRAAKLR